jgi:hypothetical protein
MDAPEIAEEIKREPSEAVEVENGAAVESQPASTEPSRYPTPVSAAPKPAITRLSEALVSMYGKQPKAVALQKATLLYNEMIQAETGENPGVTFAKVDDIGPVDAERIIAFIAAKKSGQTVNASGGTDAPPASVDEAPPADEAPAEPAPGDAYADLVLAVKRARKVMPTGGRPRPFLKESPPESGKVWFTDQGTFSQAGLSASVKILEADGSVVATEATLRQLTKILNADCDAAERGGR